MKHLKVWGIRGSLIGDGLMSLCVLNRIKKSHPDSYVYWQVARKCAQAAPLYFNHPFIDKIVISDCDEGMGPADKQIAAQCDIVFDVMPGHPLQQDWPNYRNIYEETFVMAGLPIEEYHAMTPEERRPKLTKWFNVEASPKTVAIWPCAGYGGERKRHPSQMWYQTLTMLLNGLGYKVIQFGHPKDFHIGADLDVRDTNFFDQIKRTCGCDLVISTDSGSGLIFGAYGMNQITLLTNHFPGHVRNLCAFGPDNPRNTNLFAADDADKITHDSVLEALKNQL